MDSGVRSDITSEAVQDAMDAALQSAPAAAGASPWMRGRGWDVAWLSGSCIVVPAVLVLVWAGVSSLVLNIAVTALIGGPHLFSTFLATYMDPRFRRSHGGLLLAAAIAAPAFVIILTFVNFQVLLSVFIFAASVHVLQQNAYLTDIYRRRARTREPVWSRIVDYGLLMICIYPVASYKLVHGDFSLGEVEILIPSILMTPATYWAVWFVFAFFLVAWIGKTLGEQRRGVLNHPKTVLIGITTVIAFLVPMASSGARLELAFQSVNSWHSIQYLGLIWLVQKVRKDRGLIESPFVARISGSGRAAWTFYGFCLLVTILLLGFVFGLIRLDPFGITPPRYYYMGVLSCLLVHYILDGYLFTVSVMRSSKVERIPLAAPVVA